MSNDILISKAPEDPEKKKLWANDLLRTQIGMWVSDGAKCAYCKIPYKNVDDFLQRNPKGGRTKDWDDSFASFNLNKQDQ